MIFNVTIRFAENQEALSDHSHTYKPGSIVDQFRVEAESLAAAESVVEAIDGGNRYGYDGSRAFNAMALEAIVEPA